MSQGVAVFLGRSKTYSGVEYVVDGSKVSVTNRVNGQVIETFTIAEPVYLSGDRVQAWDVERDGGTFERLSIVKGCGCGGLPPYKPDDGYSGRLP